MNKTFIRFRVVASDFEDYEIPNVCDRVVYERDGKQYTLGLCVEILAVNLMREDGYEFDVDKKIPKETLEKYMNKAIDILFPDEEEEVNDE